MSDKETLSDKLTGSIFDRVSGFFETMWSHVWSGLATSMDILTNGLVSSIVKRTEFGRFIGLPEKVMKTSDELKPPPEIQKVLDTLREDGTAMGAVAALFYTVLYDLMIAASTIPAMHGKGVLKANKDFMPSAMDMSTLMNLWFKNPELKEYVTEKARENGFSIEDIEKIFMAGRALLDEGSIRNLSLRDIISNKDVKDLLKKHGYDDTQIELLTKLFYVVPPVGDIVRMAVREAFTPEVVAAYGLHSDLPPDYITKAKQAGLNDEWAMAYWAAHWELPSITLAFDMFHRGIISKEDIELLLRTQDVMPYWRDKIIDVAYTPYTRVDVRRMYGLGILNEDDVFQSYKDIGYDDEKAGKMTEFTIHYETKKEKDLTKAEILDGYKKRLIALETTINYLIGLGYSEDEADYYISKCDYDVAKENKNISTSNVKKMYLKNIINENKVYELLGKLNIGSQEIQYLITLWDREKEVKDTDFPIGALHKAYKEGIINKDTYIYELQGKGYADKYIDWFIQIYGSK